MGHCAEADLSLEAYQYHLPPGYIAQNPVEPRDQARLLAVTSPTEHQHHHVFDLPDLLRPGDLLVLNDTKVIPARLYGHKLGGSQVEVLLLEALGPSRWLALVKPGRRLKPGTVIHFGADPDRPELIAQIAATDEATGGRVLDFAVPSGAALEALIDALGQVPLPPYITASEALPERYQTIYAKHQGAVAAPTAGLHFTQGLFERLRARGINHAFLTLHVGVGTFRPVEAATITDHKMHGEWLEVPEATVAAIQAAKAQGGRVIAVGTTVTRALEGAAQGGELRPFQGKTELFIYPGYRWQVVDGLMTNFHLPGSSLLMLVSALVGRQRLMDIYQAAIAAQYRFYSFGDAMVILPEARIN
ncbi:MAG: tRNA preQ1(34) S-adenosylmethionine ribosyltransferase-isomerase QueA [Leptolyngbya sp. RL_3_1]|nr:tRNA preQ1(34) S-adenosylmethionine ribosyltransferase-isomerase QueA [Leptolyngbya sp. RL_3_1]